MIGVIYPFAEAAPRLHEGLPNLHLSGSILLESAGERAAHRNIDRTRREGLSDGSLITDIAERLSVDGSPTLRRYYRNRR